MANNQTNGDGRDLQIITSDYWQDNSKSVPTGWIVYDDQAVWGFCDGTGQDARELAIADAREYLDSASKIKRCRCKLATTAVMAYIETYGGDCLQYIDLSDEVAVSVFAVNKFGRHIALDEAMLAMDPELRDKVRQRKIDDPSEFLKAYAAEHKAAHSETFSYYEGAK